MPALRHRNALTALISALALAAVPASAVADARAVIVDCQDGQIDGRYSQRDYAQALKNIPTDVDEYTDCRDVIRRAQIGSATTGASKGRPGDGPGAPGAAGGAGSGPVGGAFVTPQDVLAGATAQEQAEVAKATAQGGSAPVQLGSQTVSPDTAAFSPDGAANVVPTPLIVALVLLGLGLVAGAAQTVRSRVLDGRPPAV